MTVPQPNFVPPRPMPSPGPAPRPQMPVQQAKPSPSLLQRWRVPAIVGVAGLAVGAALAGGIAEGVTIPKWKGQVAAVAAGRDDALVQVEQLTGERDDLKGERDDLKSQLTTSQAKANKAENELAEERAALDSRSAALDTRASEVEAAEKAVAEREAAVTRTEKAVEASKITEGTWTVGRDVKAGKYVVDSPVNDTCYWAIYKSGTNGGVIIENDIVTGGRPTVSLKEGQDFTTQRCGSWIPA